MDVLWCLVCLCCVCDRPGFRCPQCSGPRRRYAKKVGDRVGTTLDGGDAPILIFSFGGVIATIAFGIWAVDNL